MSQVGSGYLHDPGDHGLNEAIHNQGRSETHLRADVNIITFVKLTPIQTGQ